MRSNDRGMVARLSSYPMEKLYPNVARHYTDLSADGREEQEVQTTHRTSRAPPKNHHAPPCPPTMTGHGRDRGQPWPANAVVARSSAVMVKRLRVERALQRNRPVRMIQVPDVNEV
jgi:hypothetical protein